MNEIFHKIAAKASRIFGSSYAFLAAIFVILVWALAGPVFGFSTTWQLVINTFTTITTFLMVFLIQNSQNRGARAVQLKLDELIKSVRGARDVLINLEDLSDEELDALHEDFQKLRDIAYSRHAKELHSRVKEEHRRRGLNSK